VTPRRGSLQSASGFGRIERQLRQDVELRTCRRNRDVEHFGNDLCPTVQEIGPAILDLEPAQVFLGLRLIEKDEVLGAVTPEAARDTGLRAGAPVLVGGADYPTAVYGSGACRPGLASDVTGTSCILTLIADAPLLDAEICNVATIEGRWGPFVLLETGGDAVRAAQPNGVI